MHPGDSQSPKSDTQQATVAKDQSNEGQGVLLD